MPSFKYATEAPAVSPTSRVGDHEYQAPTFPIGHFTKYAGNPLLVPNAEHEFESAHLYNAAAIVVDDRVFLLYRAQNAALESSIGLAWSDDGLNFTRLNRPVLSATEPWEAGGGVEDPRIGYFVGDDDRTGLKSGGRFVLTYTAWDKKTPRLCLATSTDLVHWVKQPPLFPDFEDVAYEAAGRMEIRHGHTKAGVIFPERNRHGRYVMLFGDSFLYRAESEDLVHWTAAPFAAHFAAPRPGPSWESRLLESGPPPMRTRDGRHWILVYNAATLGGAEGFNNNQYSIGQMLVDLEDMEGGPVARLERPALTVTAENEQRGLVNNVVFCEGLVQFRGQWLLYFGQGDSELGVATAKLG